MLTIRKWSQTLCSFQALSVFAYVCIILVNIVMKNDELKKLEFIVSSYILNTFFYH